MSWTSKTTPQFCTSKFGVGSAAWTSGIAKRISQSFQDVNWMGWRTAPPFGVWIPPNLSKYWNAGQKKQTSESPWLFPSDPLIFTVITVRDWGAGIISLVGLVALIGFHRLRCRRINSLASLVHIVRNVQWCLQAKDKPTGSNEKISYMKYAWCNIYHKRRKSFVFYIFFSNCTIPFHTCPYFHKDWSENSYLNKENSTWLLESILFQRRLFRIVFRPLKNHTLNSSLQILDFQIVTPISWFAPLLWSEYVIWLMIWYNQDSWWNLPSRSSNDELWWTRNHKGSAVLISLVWLNETIQQLLIEPAVPVSQYLIILSSKSNFRRRTHRKPWLLTFHVSTFSQRMSEGDHDVTKMDSLWLNMRNLKDKHLPHSVCDQVQTFASALWLSVLNYLQNKTHAEKHQMW